MVTSLLATLLGLGLVLYVPETISSETFLAYRWTIGGFFLYQVVATLLLGASDIFSTSPLDGIRERLTKTSLGWRARHRWQPELPSHPGVGEEAQWNSTLNVANTRIRPGKVKLRSPADILEGLVGIGLGIMVAGIFYSTSDAELGILTNWVLVWNLPLLIINSGAYCITRFLPRMVPQVWHQHSLLINQSNHPRRAKNLGIKKILGAFGTLLVSITRFFQLPRPEHSRIEAWLVRLNRAYTREIAGVRNMWIWVSSYRFPLVLLAVAINIISYGQGPVPPISSFLGWIALVPLFWVLKTSGFSQTLWYLSLFGGLQAIGLSYLANNLDGYSFPFTILTSLASYLVYGLVVSLFRNGLYKPQILGRHDWILWPLSWTFFEYLRGFGNELYTWGFIGVSQGTNQLLIPLLDITGVWGLSFLVILVNSMISHITLPHPLRKTLWNKPYPIPLTARRRFSVSITVFCLFVALGYGQILYWDNPQFLEGQFFDKNQRIPALLNPLISTQQGAWLPITAGVIFFFILFWILLFRANEFVARNYIPQREFPDQ